MNKQEYKQPQYCKACEECKNKLLDFEICYNGKSGNKCPKRLDKEYNKRVNTPM